MTMWRGIFLGWAALTLAQTQAPVLRSSTDLVVVDVQVTNRTGDVISDLAQSDFTLKVDGKPRPIVSFLHDPIDAARPAKRGGAGATTTLWMGPAVEAQSYVMVVVDPWMMRPDSSRSLLDQAADFVEKLPAAHAVALRSPSGARYPFSVNRQPIVAALRKMLGGLGSTIKPSPGDSQPAIDSIESAIDDLRDVEGRKTIVFIIDVLVDLGDRLRFIAARAADANITIHTISTDNTVQSLVDVRKRQPDDHPTLGDGSAGVVLSDMTGGLTLRRTNNGSIVMPRIAALLSEQYLLSFAVIGADKDGKPHHIDVSVNRGGADVRARSSFVR